MLSLLLVAFSTLSDQSKLELLALELLVVSCCCEQRSDTGVELPPWPFAELDVEPCISLNSAYGCSTVRIFFI